MKPDVLLTSTVPVAVFILGVAAGLEVMSYRMLLVMSVISFGVLVASYGEIDINWIGVIYQMGGVVAEALRLIFMEILVKRKGRKLNPISVMYYVSPCRHVIYTYKLDHIFFHCMLYIQIVLFTLIKSVYSLQCSLLVHPMDDFGEAKDGCSEVLEFSTFHAHTQLSLYFCPKRVSFCCYIPYKCFDHSCCWSCEGLGGCIIISTSFCGHKANSHQYLWLCNR